MTLNEIDDPLLGRLGRLPLPPPLEERPERTKMRCHAVIARRQQQIDRRTSRALFWGRVLEPALIGGLALIYLSFVIGGVLRVQILL
jgi:hypothetical protein